ncbi:MAG TPA: hypothetical protein VFU23_10895 [Gemmatimonadales bacterium]|nr:hypothetical protein [Gemmatimonadales bacterium]
MLTEPRPGDRRAVDQGAVGAAQVAQGDPVGVGAQLGVLPGDGVVFEGKPGAGGPARDDRVPGRQRPRSAAIERLEPEAGGRIQRGAATR